MTTQQKLAATWNINAKDFPTSGSPEEKARFLLGYAILAPSVHNTQPWLCTVKKESIELYLDTDRALSSSDPSQRESYISLGAFVSNFCIAAQEFGGTTEIAWLPKGRKHRVHAATIRYSFHEIKQGETSKVLEAIRNRRVNRSHYQDKEVNPAVVQILAKHAEKHPTLNLTFLPQSASKKVAEIIEQGTQLAFTRAGFRSELADYITPNISPRLDGIPGYTANYGLLRSFLAPIGIRNLDALGVSQGRRDALLLTSAPVKALISSATDDYLGWLTTGYLLEELSLILTEHNLAYSILAGPIEAPRASEKVRELLQLDQAPQVLFCFGHCSKLANHSPRRPVSAILK